VYFPLSYLPLPATPHQTPHQTASPAGSPLMPHNGRLFKAWLVPWLQICGKVGVEQILLHPQRMNLPTHASTINDVIM